MAELTYWNDPDLPLTVEFDTEAMERLRRAAVDGLLALPRVGMGVGGFLLGSHEGGKVSIHDHLEIPCSHTFGPSFRLTSDELAGAKAMTRGLNVVGAYRSKTRASNARAAPGIGDEDRKLFGALCPEAWQLMLLVTPSTTDMTRGMMYGRKRGGSLVGGAELPMQIIAAPPDVNGSEPEPAPVIPSARQPEPKPQPAVKSQVRPVAPPQPAVAAAESPFIPEPAAGTEFRWETRHALTPPSENRWWKWVAALVVVICLAAGVFFRSDLWHPHPKLQLTSFDKNGQLTLEWSRSAVIGDATGSVRIRDGSESGVFELSSPQLHSGVFRYERKTGQVTAVLRAGSVEETTTFTGEAPTFR